MVAAIVCREMKWTLEEFRSQPSWFVAVLVSYLSEEATHLKRQSKKK